MTPDQCLLTGMLLCPGCVCVVQSCQLMEKQNQMKNRNKEKKSLQTMPELEKSVVQEARLMG